jgi:hypothetical protein
MKHKIYDLDFYVWYWISIVEKKDLNFSIKYGLFILKVKHTSQFMNC